jgi:hypothetical protein
MAVAFKSAVERRWFVSAFLSSAFWIVIAVVVGHLMADRYNSPWGIAFFVWGAFILVSIAWWLSKQIVAWLVWRVLWRKTAANELVAAFEKAKLPKPPHNLRSAEDWFAELAMGEDAAKLTIEQRLFAGAHYLRLHEFGPQQGIFAALRLKTLYEEAIGAFGSTFPRADRY